MLACIVVGGTHLTVEVVLHEVPEVMLALGFWLLAFGFFGPLTEVGSAVGVSVDAELGIGLEPRLVLFEEFLIIRTTAQGGPLLLEEFVQIVHLGRRHALIVYLRQCVELVAQRLVVAAALGILEGRQLAKVHILRMEGVDADAIIGIAVLPRVGDAGVIDGQHLDDAQPHLIGPVDHQLKVAKVAHAKAALRAQREDGNHHAGPLPWVDGEESLWQFVDHHLAVGHLLALETAVSALFPYRRHITTADDDKLELEVPPRQLVSIKGGHPLMTLVLGHGHGSPGIPRSQRHRRTDECQTLVGTQLGSTNLEAYGAAILCLGAQLALTGHDTIGDGRAVHIGILRNIYPMVVYGIRRCLLGGKLEAVGLYQPLVA